MNSISDFAEMVTDFDKLKQSTMMDCFAYFLAVHAKRERFTAKDINQCYIDLSIPPYANIPQYLVDNSKKPFGKSKKAQKFIKKGSTYTLTRIFSDEVKKMVIIDAPKIEISKTLRSLLPTLTSSSEKNYLEEAIKTFEVEAYRAAIIMVWLLTIDHIYEHILRDMAKKTNFITALRAVNNKTNINCKDDFGDLKESVFLVVCKSAGIISHDVWKILDVKLGIRNSFAHPSNVHLPKSKALEFIEDLVNNVVLKY